MTSRSARQIAGLFLCVWTVKHGVSASHFVTIQQQFFTTIRVRCASGQIVHFPPQTRRSGKLGRGNDRHKVRVKSKMGRFSFSAGKAGGKYGKVDAAAVALLLLQDDPAKKLRSCAPRSSLSSYPFSGMLPAPESASGNNDSGFVTIGDYLCFEGGRSHSDATEMSLLASQECRAGERADEGDAQKIAAPEMERGWMRRGQRGLRTRRGIARREEYVRGSTSLRNGSERNRVTC
ncbi:hypothetical protein [Rhizobium sp. AC44/96]|uniref:hypothetical protein n=1 Tax=Rhizobium sp. AC44/96 TaxID=1841654 RepID=UPI0013011F20|nr:hypothetical protein [Rhizobium sp. AC44/96]